MSTLRVCDWNHNDNRDSPFAEHFLDVLYLPFPNVLKKRSGNGVVRVVIVIGITVTIKL
jgi:hypothetical protein